MKKNVGTIDKVVRILAAILITVLYFTDIITVGIVFVVLAAVFAITSLISFCPLYAIFGLSTCPVKNPA